MFSFEILCIFLSIPLVKSINIQYINNSQLVPGENASYTMITNATCIQCLCKLIQSYRALTCFSNYTCQLFPSFPEFYKIQASMENSFYFLPIIDYVPIQCYMSNITALLQKIDNGTRTYMPAIDSQQLVQDNEGHLATIDGKTSEFIRFDENNLTIIDNITFDQSPIAMTFSNDAYYIVLINSSIVVLDSYNLTVLNTMDFDFITDPIDIMFLNNGELMVMALSNSDLIIFLEQKDISPPNYTLAYNLTTNCSSPQALQRVNDSFFHATSRLTNTIYSYSLIENSTTWIEEIFLNLTSIAENNTISSVTIDQYGRYWVSFRSSTVLIFDAQGAEVGNFTIPNGVITHIFMGNNSVMYISEQQGNESQIIRIDPHSGC